MKKIYIKSLKEQFVPAEFTLLRYWSEILEKKQRGSTLVYLQLQTGINRDTSNELEGYSWIGRKELCRRCNITEPTLSKIFSVLEKEGFIRKHRRGLGQTNLYEILPVPKPKDLEEKKLIEVENNSIFSETLDKKKVASVTRAKRSSYQDKDIEEWKINNFERYFRDRYKEKFDTDYGVLDGKERKHLKLLQQQYGNKKLKMLIDYVIDNSEDLEIEDYPTIAAIYGFRRTWMMRAEKGKFKKKKQGQSGKVIDKEEEYDW